MLINAITKSKYTQTLLLLFSAPSSQFTRKFQRTSISVPKLFVCLFELSRNFRGCKHKFFSLAVTNEYLCGENSRKFYLTTNFLSVEAVLSLVGHYLLKHFIIAFLNLYFKCSNYIM